MRMSGSSMWLGPRPHRLLDETTKRRELAEAGARRLDAGRWPSSWHLTVGQVGGSQAGPGKDRLTGRDGDCGGPETALQW